MPQHPWSHIAINFVTDLANSKGLITIMIIIGHFSKACTLIPLKEKPTAMEIAEAPFQQVFKIYSLMEDIVSD